MTCAPDRAMREAMKAVAIRIDEIEKRLQELEKPKKPDKEKK